MNDPQFVWQLAGIIVTGLTGVTKYFKWVPDTRVVKQLTALAFSLLTVIVIPKVLGQPLPEVGAILVNVVETWLSAMALYAITKTAREIKNGPVVKKPGAKKPKKKTIK